MNRSHRSSRPSPAHGLVGIISRIDIIKTVLEPEFLAFGSLGPL
jgi:hypothetical protein